MTRTDKKLFLSGIVLSSLLAGIFWRPPDASAYQIKRVIRGSYTLASAAEAATLDLNDPNGDSNTADTLLGNPLDELNLEKSFLIVTYSCNSTDRTVNDIMYAIDDPKKRAVGFKLSEGMEVPKELDGKFKFARQKSKLAGTIRGSFFVIKGEY